MAEQNQPTLTDQVAGVSGPYQDRVAQIGLNNQSQANLDLINQLTQMNQQYAQLEKNQQDLAAQPDANLGEDLRSTEGIVALLGALLGGGIAASQGSGQGVEAAGSALQSYIGTRGSMVDQYNQSLATKREQAAQMTEQSQEMLNQQRQRLITLLQSQPDMFLDPETGQPAVDPRLLGYASTGYMLPVNPWTNHALKNRTRMQEEMIAFGKKLFLEGDTAETRAQGLRVLGQSMGVQWSDAMYRVAASGNERDAYLQLIEDNYFTPDSIFGAMLKGQQEGKSIVEVFDMFVPELGADETGRKTIPQAQLDALAELARRMEANPHLFNPELTFDDRVREAFADPGEENYRVLLIDRWGESEVSKELVLRQMESSLATIMTLERLLEKGVPEEFLTPYGISKNDPDWATQLAVQFTQHMMPGLKSLEGQTVQRRVSTVRYGLERAVAGFPGFNQAPEDVVRAWALMTVLQTKKKHTDTVSQVLDYDAFIADINKYKTNAQTAVDSFLTFYTAPSPPAQGGE